MSGRKGGGMRDATKVNTNNKNIRIDKVKKKTAKIILTMKGKEEETREPR